MQQVATVIGNCRWKEATWSPHTFYFPPFLLTVERVKAESAQAAAKMLEEMQIKNQQMMEQKESHQEHVKQLTEKMERERGPVIGRAGENSCSQTAGIKLQHREVPVILFSLHSLVTNGPTVRT